MHETLQRFADDLAFDYAKGHLTEPANDDQLFRSIATELFTYWGYGVGLDIVRAYEDAHGSAALSEVDALAWAVAEIYEGFTGGPDVETD